MKYLKLFEDYSNPMLEQRKDMLSLRNNLDTYFKEHHPELKITFDIRGEYPEEYLGDYIEITSADIKMTLSTTHEGKIFADYGDEDDREIFDKTDVDNIIFMIEEQFRVNENVSDWDDEEEEEDDLSIMFETIELDDDAIEYGFENGYIFHIGKIIDYLSKHGINGVQVKDFKGKSIDTAMGGTDIIITIKIPTTDKETLIKIKNDLERFEYFESVKITKNSIKISYSADSILVYFQPEIFLNEHDL